MIRIIRFLLPVLAVAVCVNFANAQTVSFRNFSSFQDIVPGVDFFAASRQTVAPYEEAAAQAIEKLKYLLGDDIPKGAIFICTNLAQRDSLYEPVVMRQGYSWVLISVAAEVRMQEQMDRMRSQMGDNIPAEIRQRMNSMSSDMTSVVDRQAAVNMARDIAFAVLQVLTNDETFQFRASRVDDVGKSQLQDWLDISIAAYTSGDRSSIRYLQENIDMMFPIEDVLFMARPFVPTTTATTQQRSGGGQGGQMGPGGGGQGGAPKAKASGNTAGGGTPQRTLSKDEQDRMLFDGQAISFLEYLMEKFGIEKIRDLIKFAMGKNESWDYVTRTDMLGRDFTKIETEWTAWMMKLSIPDSKPKPKPKVQ